MTKNIVFGLLIFFLVAAFFIVYQSGIMRKLSTKITEIKIGDRVFNVEIADTIASRAKGLSSHEPLSDNQGMLFVFPFAAPQVFWMKGMKFPIDIIWIKDDKVIGMAVGAGVEAGPNYAFYKSSEAVDKVLEINAGLVSRLGIQTGDILQINGN